GLRPQRRVAGLEPGRPDRDDPVREPSPPLTDRIARTRRGMSAPGRPASESPRLPLRVVVLAGQRRGAVKPLAERFGTSHKCLIPLHGRPLIAHVLEMLAGHPRVESLVVSVERDAFDGIYDVISSMPGK